eukprot:scaffold120506_cov36-Tisochrysis_lutea.AAC.1
MGRAASCARNSARPPLGCNGRVCCNSADPDGRTLVDSSERICAYYATSRIPHPRTSAGYRPCPTPLPAPPLVHPLSSVWGGRLMCTTLGLALGQAGGRASWRAVKCRLALGCRVVGAQPFAIRLSPGGFVFPGRLALRARVLSL